MSLLKKREYEGKDNDDNTKIKEVKLTVNIQEDEDEVEEEIVTSTISSSLQPFHSIPQQTSSSNSNEIGLFQNLFYGEDSDDINAWTNILLQNGFKNEKYFLKTFIKAYGNNKDEMVHSLMELEFQRIYAKIIADRILSAGLSSLLTIILFLFNSYFV